MVAVVAFQMGLALVPGDFNDVNGTNVAGFGIQFIQKGQHLLLIGNGNIESRQIGMLFQQSLKFADVAEWKVQVTCVDAFVFKFFAEVFLRKGMGEGITNETESTHNEIGRASCRE